MKTIVRYTLALPTFGIGLGYVALAFLLGFARRPRIEGDVITAVWRDWWVYGWEWYYSTTAGRGIIFHPEHTAERPPDPYTRATERTRFHEMVHVRQAEDLCALGFFLAILAACCGHWMLGLWIWVLMPAGHLLGYLMAWLRGGDAYLDAEHERAAYAQEREKFFYDEQREAT